MTLRKPKAKGKKKKQKKDDSEKWDRIDQDGSDGEDGGSTAVGSQIGVDASAGIEDPLLTTPLPRYNAMLAVLKNTLYM